MLGTLYIYPKWFVMTQIFKLTEFFLVRFMFFDASQPTNQHFMAHFNSTAVLSCTNKVQGCCHFLLFVHYLLDLFKSVCSFACVCVSEYLYHGNFNVTHTETDAALTALVIKKISFPLIVKINQKFLI